MVAAGPVGSVVAAQLDSPTGIAVDGNGNVLVADTNNGRIEKFSSTGTFLTTFGSKGIGRGELAAPNGITVDRTYLCSEGVESSCEKTRRRWDIHRRVTGPEPGLYGPRRIAIGPEDSVYVVDQGHCRIAKFSPEGQAVATRGSKGYGDGQFDDPTSVTVDATTNGVYVANPRNKRIQVFDSNGKFLTKWSVAEWGQAVGFEDLVIDRQRGPALCVERTHERRARF